MTEEKEIGEKIIALFLWKGELVNVVMG